MSSSKDGSFSFACLFYRFCKSKTGFKTCMLKKCDCFASRTKMKQTQAAFVRAHFNIYLEHVPLCLSAFYYQNICLLVSLCSDWRKLSILAGLLCLIRAGIGPQLCHSEINYSLTSSVLFSWCSLRGEGNGSFLCESAAPPQPAPYYLSLTEYTHRQDWQEAVLALPHPEILMCLCAQLLSF